MRVEALLRGAWPAVVMLALIWATVGCGGGGGGEISEQEAREALPRMVLQEAQLPDGLARAGEKFTTNEQLAASEVGGVPEAAKIEEWGRVLGYETDFQAAELPSGPLITGINIAASAYKTPEGASASFEDTTQRARDADWAAFYTDLTEFQEQEVQRELPADGTFWLRLSGLRARIDGEGQVLVVDDQIAYRVGPVRGFLRVLTSDDAGTDRNLVISQVDALLRTQIQNTREALDGLN
jgi:hypothetical protein